MENNYILLQSCNLKIGMMAVNGVWRTKLSGNDIELDACMERYLAYILVGKKNYNEVSSTLRLINRRITPIDIESFISNFIESHPSEEMEFDMDLVPIYATDTIHSFVPNSFCYDVPLTKAQESDLLDILKNKEINRKIAVEQWFYRYINRYNLIPKYKKDVPIQHEELARNFCVSHGIDIDKLGEVESVKVSNKPLRSRKRSYLFYLKCYCGIMVYLAIAIMFIFYGDKVRDPFMLGTILMTIGWLMIGIPLYLIFGRK